MNSEAGLTPLVVWTRSGLDWEKDQKSLQSLPAEVISVPCIERSPLKLKEEKGLWKSLQKMSLEYGSLAFWPSSYTVECFKKLPDTAREVMANSKHIAIGGATFEALSRTEISEKKIDSNCSFNGAESALEYLRRAYLNSEQRFPLVFLPGAVERSFDGLGYLQRWNSKTKVLKMDLYRTIGVVSAASALLFCQKSVARPCVLVFTSPSAVRAWFGAGRALVRVPPDMVFALGATTAQEWERHYPKLQPKCPSQPSISGLIDLIKSDLNF